MDRDVAVNVARREASTTRTALDQRHEAKLIALKDKVQELVGATDSMVTYASNFMNEFHDRTHTVYSSSDDLVDSRISQGLLDTRYQEDRTRICVAPLSGMFPTILKKEHLLGGPVYPSESAVRLNVSIRGKTPVRGGASVRGGSNRGSSISLQLRTPLSGGHGSRGASEGASGADSMGPYSRYRIISAISYCSLMTLWFPNSHLKSFVLCHQCIVPYCKILVQCLR